MDTDTNVDAQLNLQSEIMLEGMEAIRNISGGLLAWDLKADDERLATIHAVSKALYSFDARSEVSLGVSRDTMQRLKDEHPEIADMCPKAYAWLDDV
ncbi:hypothetical protein [Falsirhodobacter halotolerans]|uniref:hypothetical protein n=1 Tax=Falsirhodobacter halotolerans TaxID=1146892 RepID=UPI001FD40726|nr:hypothetical protein [Falsirhodobacter halotolerans]MCJ8138407.1 hypothetical protein [Falsirhodobacter halotolerans]